MGKISEPKNYSALAKVIFWAQKKKYGEALNPTRMWARSPILLLGLQIFYRCIDRRSSPIPPTLRALINVKVSQLNNCDFCVDISSSILLKNKISMEKIEALPRYKDHRLFTDLEISALDYATAMTTNQVNDTVFGNLKKFFDADAIVELTALIGYQNLSSKFNAALGVTNQGFCTIPEIQDEK